MLLKIIWNFVVLAVVIQVALACNGYKLKVLKLENCAGPNAVVNIDPELSVELNEECEISTTGCVVNKAYNTAISSIKVVKDGSLIAEYKMDLCSMAEQMKKYLEAFGATQSCPIKEGKICLNGEKINISNFKSFLGMTRGITVVDYEIEHDTGKSCIHLELEVSSS